MAKTLWIGAALLLVAVGTIVGASTPRTMRSEPAAAISLDPHQIHLAIDMTKLPEETVREPF